MSLGQSVRGGTQWLITKGVGAQVIQFLFGLILARLLVPEDFGLMATIQIFTGLAGLVAGGGLAKALVQAKELSPHDYQVVFTLQLGIGVAIYGLFFLIAPWFATWFHDARYSDLLRVSALGFLLRPFVNTMNAHLQREMRFKAQVGIAFGTMACAGISSVALAWHGYGVWSFIISGLLAGLINTSSLYFATRLKLALRFQREAARRLSGFGLRFSANTLVAYINQQIDNLTVSRLLGPAQLGLYNKAASLHYIPIDIIGESAYQTIFRALSKIQDDISTSRYLYFRTLTLVSVYTLPFYIGLGWVAEPLITILYGAKWAAAAEPLRILVFAGLFHCIIRPSRAVTAAQNQLGAELRIQVTYGLMLVAACLVGARWGLAGIALAMVSVTAIQAWRLYRLASRCLGGRTIDLVRALKPAAVLNGLLFITLAATHAGLNIVAPQLHQALYLMGMTGMGALVYVVGFLFLPLPGLASEAQRWKTTLRIAKPRP